MASFLQVCRSVKARPSCIGFIFSRSRYSYVRRTSSSRHFPCNYSQQHAHNSWLVLLSIRDSSLLSRHPPPRSPAEKFLLTDKRHNRVEEKPIFRSSALPAKHHPSKRISWLPIQFTARGGSIYPRWWSPSPRNPWNFHSSTPLSRHYLCRYTSGGLEYPSEILDDELLAEKRKKEEGFLNFESEKIDESLLRKQNLDSILFQISRRGRSESTFDCATPIRIRRVGAIKRDGRHTYIYTFRVIPLVDNNDKDVRLIKDRRRNGLAKKACSQGIHRGGMSRFSTPIFPRPLPREIA